MARRTASTMRMFSNRTARRLLDERGTPLGKSIPKGCPNVRRAENTIEECRKSIASAAALPRRKLAIDDSAGLHAFRHGLATELAEASVPITVLQTQMRHADVKTTLRVYAHIIPQSQR